MTVGCGEEKEKENKTTPGGLNAHVRSSMMKLLRSSISRGLTHGTVKPYQAVTHTRMHIHRQQSQMPPVTP